MLVFTAVALVFGSLSGVVQVLRWTSQWSNGWYLVEQASWIVSIGGLQVGRKKYSSQWLVAPLIWRRLARCVDAFTRATSSPSHSPVGPLSVARSAALSRHLVCPCLYASSLTQLPPLPNVRIEHRRDVYTVDTGTIRSHAADGYQELQYPTLHPIQNISGRKALLSVWQLCYGQPRAGSCVC